MKKRQKNGEFLDIEERKIIARSSLFKIAGNIKTKEEEELEHNLSTLSKMTKFYKMDHELSNSAKENLISNQKSFDNVYPEDENAVLSKLKDDLREGNRCPI